MGGGGGSKIRLTAGNFFAAYSRSVFAGVFPRSRFIVSGEANVLLARAANSQGSSPTVENEIT